MKKYTRVETVEAIQWTGDNTNEIRALVPFLSHPDRELPNQGELTMWWDIVEHYVYPGDWLVRDNEVGWRLYSDNTFHQFHEEGDELALNMNKCEAPGCNNPQSDKVMQIWVGGNAGPWEVCGCCFDAFANGYNAGQEELKKRLYSYFQRLIEGPRKV